MFIKMGCKQWTWGNQFGLRIYTPSIHEIANIDDFPSSDGRWNSLSDFLASVSRRNVPPYSKSLLIVDNRLQQPQIEATMTIAKHGNTSQGYITAPQNTWLSDFVNANLHIDLDFEYQASEKEDLLVVPYSVPNIVLQREKESDKINRKVKSYDRMIHYTPPQHTSEIGLYFELKEVESLRSQGFRPSHRYPYLTSRIKSLRPKKIFCDIDLFGANNNFMKFVEVKSISGAPGNPFNLTTHEWQSREACRNNRDEYDIVVYYRAGLDVLTRQVISKIENLINVPSGYLCTVA